MTTRRLLLASLLALALLPARAHAEPAAAAPEEPVFVDLDLKYVHASDHLGEIVVLNFWATWCGPCRMEIPSFVKLYDSLGPRGVRFVAAAANPRSEAETVRTFMQQNGMKFDVWLWVTAKDMRYYGVGPGIPATLLLDRKGKIRNTFVGPIREDEVRAAIEALLAEPKS